jgi:RHH-type proline utilization regulon transcriptional repressor/proline dehydrogenase/delta 1-pyrroline-5-carboxylate dehydrogenase
VGNSGNIHNHIGPIIDQSAYQRLNSYLSDANKQHRVWQSHPLLSPPYFSPTLVEVDAITSLTEEQFGPILHCYCYQPEQLNKLIEQVNQLHFGLTAAVFSRNPIWANAVAQALHVGNIYINSNTVGALVSMQPFGGMGMSGTGPKAGTLDYLKAFCSQKVVNVNHSAFGGNLDLLH